MIRAKQMGRYLEMGRSEEEAAILWGVSVATVRNRLALLDLAPQIQKAVESGIVGATLAAKEFANIPREEQPARLAELEAAGTLKGADAKENIRRLRNAKPAKEAKARMQTRDAIEAARKRLRKAGTEDALLARDVLKWAIGEGCSTDIPTRVAEALEPEEETAE